MTKILALLFMIIDHIGVIFNDNISVELYSILRSLGRLSFPLYLYYIVRGLERTRDRKKYFLRILTFAIISHIVINVTFPELNTVLNILFSFSLYIAYAIYIDNEKLKDKYSVFYITPIFIILSNFVDYLFIGFISFLILRYINKKEVRNREKARLSFVSLAALFTCSTLMGITSAYQIFGSLSGLLMFNDKLEKRVFNSKVTKWIMYIIYPAQWIILYVVKLYVK